MGIADIGTRVAQARTAKAYGYAIPGSAPPVDGSGASVGFTSPTAISTEINAIDQSAKSLLSDFQANLPQADATRQAYEAWFSETWTPFRDKNLGLGRLSGGLVFGTDELMAQAQARRAELQGFADRYQALVSKPPTAPVPPDPRTAPKPPPTTPSWWPSWAPTPPKVEIPWWVWVGGTVLAIGGGYAAYRSWRATREEVRRQQDEVYRILPTIMTHGAVAPQARDVATSACSCPNCSGGT